METQLEDFVAATSAFIALASAGITAYFAKRSIHTVERQRRLQYFIELRKWADCASDTLSETSHFIADREEALADPDKIMRLRIELSTLIDRGRWFFPNIPQDGVNETKPLASRGLRQKALNRLVNVYDVLKDFDQFAAEEHEDKKWIVFENRKEFISDIHRKIDPITLDKEISNI